MKRKNIELIDFTFKVPSEMKRLAGMERYKTPFVIEVEGEVHTARFALHETMGYYFITSSDAFFPNEVQYIEDRIWDHIKA